MTNKEFSDLFDTLADSYSFHAAFGKQSSDFALALNEYEKSFYLTKGQEAVVLGLYSGRNSTRESFESSEEERRHLADLVIEDTLYPDVSTGLKGIDNSSVFFNLPDDLWFITYESLNLEKGKCAGMTSLDVYPVRQDEYHKIKKNPFRGTGDRRALRLDITDNRVEIVSKYPVSSYYIRYIKKLQPIILVDLPDGLTINGESNKTECELHESLHQRILDIAVQTAINSRRPFARKSDN